MGLGILKWIDEKWGTGSIPKEEEESEKALMVPASEVGTINKVYSDPFSFMEELVDSPDKSLDNTSSHFSSHKNEANEAMVSIGNILNSKIKHYLDLDMGVDVIMFESSISENKEVFYFSYELDMTEIEFEATFDPEVRTTKKQDLSNLLADLKRTSLQCENVEFTPMYGNAFPSAKLTITGRYYQRGK